MEKYVQLLLVVVRGDTYTHTTTATQLQHVDRDLEKMFEHVGFEAAGRSESEV